MLLLFSSPFVSVSMSNCPQCKKSITPGEESRNYFMLQCMKDRTHYFYTHNHCYVDFISKRKGKPLLCGKCPKSNRQMMRVLSVDGKTGKVNDNSESTRSNIKKRCCHWMLKILGHIILFFTVAVLAAYSVKLIVWLGTGTPEYDLFDLMHVTLQPCLGDVIVGLSCSVGFYFLVIVFLAIDTCCKDRSCIEMCPSCCCWYSVDEARYGRYMSETTDLTRVQVHTDEPYELKRLSSISSDDEDLVTFSDELRISSESSSMETVKSSKRKKKDAFEEVSLEDDKPRMCKSEEESLANKQKRYSTVFASQPASTPTQTHKQRRMKKSVSLTEGLQSMQDNQRLQRRSSEPSFISTNKQSLASKWANKSPKTVGKFSKNTLASMSPRFHKSPRQRHNTFEKL